MEPALEAAAAAAAPAAVAPEPEPLTPSTAASASSLFGDFTKYSLSAFRSGMSGMASMAPGFDAALVATPDPDADTCHWPSADNPWPAATFPDTVPMPLPAPPEPESAAEPEPGGLGAAEDALGFLVTDDRMAAWLRWQSAPSKTEPADVDTWTSALRRCEGMAAEERQGHVGLASRGLPREYRAAAWCSLLGVEKKKKASSCSFAEYVRRSHEMQHAADRRQVELDIPRTFPEHPRFRRASPRKGDGELLQPLRQVLLALCVRDAEIGYCQGMSFVAGTLLLVLPSVEEAFWAMCCVVEDIMTGFYTRTLRGAQIETRLIAAFLEKHVPGLCAHLTRLSIPMQMYTTPWTMCLFSTTFCSETLLRCWDVLFMGGRDMIARLSLAFFRMHERRLCAMTDIVQLTTDMRGLQAGMLDADALMAAVVSSMDDVSVAQIAAQRAQATAAVDAEERAARTKALNDAVSALRDECLAEDPSKEGYTTLKKAMKTLRRLVGELREEPDNDKFRTVNASNAALQKRLTRFVSSDACLVACGFMPPTEEGSHVYLFDTGRTADLEFTKNELDLSDRRHKSDERTTESALEAERVAAAEKDKRAKQEASKEVAQRAAQEERDAEQTATVARARAQPAAAADRVTYISVESFGPVAAAAAALSDSGMSSVGSSDDLLEDYEVVCTEDAQGYTGKERGAT